MINLLKYDVYKCRKTLSTWIVLLLIVVFTIASVSITYLTLSDATLSEAATEIGSQSNATTLEDMTVAEWCIDATTGDFLLLFLIIFCVLFVCKDYTSGYIKNIFNHIHPKYSFVVSKSIVAAVFSVISLIASYLVTILYNVFIIKSEKTAFNVDFWNYSLYKIILMIAVSTIIVAISVIFTKATVSMIICIGYSILFVNPLYSIINTAVEKLLDKTDFMIQKYTLLGNLVSLTQSSDSEQHRIILIISVVAVVLSLAVSSKVFSCRDLK